jgi:4-amino-4-deoxy-L-arabinose transferase-like glycosyltransferase
MRDRNLAAMTVSKREIQILAVILVAGAALRAIGLDAQLWFDEIATLVEFVRLPFATIVSDYSSLNNHMFFTLQAKASTALFGEAAWSLRLPAALFGIASIYLIWRLARAHSRPRVALGAAALTAFSYHHIWFSQNARGYTELGFWCLLATIAYLSLLRAPKRASAVALALAVAAAHYTHLTAGFFLAALGLHYLAREGARLSRRERINRAPFFAFAAGGLLALAAYAPALPSILAQVGAVSETSAVDVMQHYQNPLWSIAEGLRTLGGPPWFGFVAAPMALGALAIGAFSLWRKSPASVVIIGLSILVTLAALTALSMRVWPRFFFVQFPFLFWLLAEGADAALLAVRERLPLLKAPQNEARAYALGLVVASALSLALTAKNYAAPKQDYEGAAAYIAAQGGSPEEVAAVGLAAFPFKAYYRPAFVEAPQAEHDKIANSRWVILIFPARTLRRYPDLASTLERDFEAPVRFRGTLGDGAVLVYRRKES